MNGMLGRHSKRVLLTGAGWTKNWSGFLASEFWHHLASAPVVQANPKLQTALVAASPNFEDAYERVMTDAAFTPRDRADLDAALVGVFEMIDVSLSAQPAPVNEYTVNDMLKYLVRAPGETVDTAYIFTLNQDLFFERKFIQWPIAQLPPPALPSIPPSPGVPLFSPNMPPFSPAIVAQLGSFSQAPLAGRTNIIKLHGSCNWRAQGAAQREMVIGTSKTARIAGSVLLSWYFDIFRSVLNQGDMRLMIAGYGFGDEHVNDAIADAVNAAGLKIYFWSTTPNLRAAITGKHRGAEILKGYLGSLNQPMSLVFPPNPMAPLSPLWRNLASSFLGVTLP